MLLIATLKKLFAEKLVATESMDAALTKALWVAYKQGYADGIENNAVSTKAPEAPRF